MHDLGNSITALAHENLIEIRNLRKVYSNGKVALDHIDLDIPAGITAIIGRNGAGKTTLMRILSTQLKPTSGTIRIMGLDTAKYEKRIRRLICSIPQEASPIGILTPLEQVKMYLVARGFSYSSADAEARSALADAGLEDNMRTPADMLSGGMKRKIFVAMALASGSEIVFLDEPTTGLDPISRYDVWAAIRRLKSHVILTTHYMEEAASLSSYIVLVDSGMVISRGRLGDLLAEFSGKVRIECRDRQEDSISMGGMFIKYVDAEKAEEYVKLGCDVKSITLDDVFIKERIDLES